MIIKTKKYKLRKSVYIKVSFRNLLRQKWWPIPLFLLAMCTAFYTKYTKTGFLCLFLTLGYLLFRYAQIYATTMVENNKIIFQPFTYHISSKSILMHINTKQYLTMTWDKVTKVKQTPKAFFLFINPLQFIHLPKRIFKSPQEIQFMKLLLKRKKLI